MSNDKEPMTSQDREELAECFRRCRGGAATVWSYSVSLCTLMIRIEVGGASTALVFHGCSTVHFTAKWTVRSLLLERVSSDPWRYLARDDEGGFPVEFGRAWSRDDFDEALRQVSDEDAPSSDAV